MNVVVVIIISGICVRVRAVITVAVAVTDIAGIGVVGVCRAAGGVDAQPQKISAEVVGVEVGDGEEVGRRRGGRGGVDGGRGGG
ncbi:hypothetical protein B0J18DRAFT_420139 [Chaetomium sp. MPI-SDFR-AT-0129]|nr:hypothetical protein B0J18DRAFT_420139 [Chaetomium sp. MPI-SDFR-AT-0129]